MRESRRRGRCHWWSQGGREADGAPLFLWIRIQEQMGTAIIGRIYAGQPSVVEKQQRTTSSRLGIGSARARADACNDDDAWCLRRWIERRGVNLAAEGARRRRRLDWGGRRCGGCRRAGATGRLRRWGGGAAWRRKGWECRGGRQRRWGRRKGGENGSGMRAVEGVAAAWIGGLRVGERRERSRFEGDACAGCVGRERRYEPFD